MLQALDADAVRRWAAAGVRALDADREAIDSINVYPVADGDTGTNLLHTMRSALDALVGDPADAVGTAVSALAKGAVAGARGNSGVILSQVLRGLAESWEGTRTVSGAALRGALRRADELATAAVAKPVAGTVLSVLAAAADAAEECPSDLLDDVARAAVKAATQALADTPRQLAVLAERGVVDAGGRGLLLLLDALAMVVSERLDSDVEHDLTPISAPRTALVHESSGFEYEVMYLLDGLADEQVLRERLARLGDSVVVAGDGHGLWSVHVHCDDVGAAIEVGVENGRPHRITVTRFAAQRAQFARDRAVVAIVAGEDAAELFRAEGASVLMLADGREPAVGDLVDVLAETGAAQVVVLPNDIGLADLVSQAAERDGRDVVVVPTASPVQGLAALAVHDPTRRSGDDVVAMAEAAAATRRGELVIAQREAITWVGRCQPGDALGMIDGEVVLIEPSPADLVAAACRLVDRMLDGGGELVTVFAGTDAPAGLDEELGRHLRLSHPEAELTGYAGGQPGTVALIGVE
ncbi:DAK2 domain-containing protein [Kutzneria sp. 744]|uniref:DAK2 domain-containing protein n=1 Tax=Kutzneria sp. (strain 744) TaxID=345341 RepID=UPI0004BCB19F|nr:DAK2 domain-containing protein [Kutzneria sp. 744]